MNQREAKQALDKEIEAATEAYRAAIDAANRACITALDAAMERYGQRIAVTKERHSREKAPLIKNASEVTAIWDMTNGIDPTHYIRSLRDD